MWRLTLLALFLTACAPEKKVIDIGIKPSPPPDTSLIATIPYGCVALVTNGNLDTGSHEFPLGNIQYAVPFDCGMREGKHCFYFVNLNTSNGTKIEDTRCE